MILGWSSGKKNVATGVRRASSDAVEPDHLQAGAVDEERNAVQVADADEVGAVLDQRDELLAVGLGPLAVGDVDAGRRQKQDLDRPRP